MMTFKKRKRIRKRIYRRVDFAIQAGHRGEIKEGDNYLNLARELRNLRNKMLIVKPVIIGALRTILKVFEKEQEELEIGGRIETI